MTNTVQKKVFILLLYRVFDLTELYISVYRLNHWHAFMMSKLIPVRCW